MINRTTPLKYQSGFDYQVAEDFTIDTGIVTEYGAKWHFSYLDPDGLLTIKRGYCWDGASGPAWDTKNSLSASCVHDVLYQLMRKGLLSTEHKARVDKLFHEMLIENGMWKFRADAWYRAVKEFGFEAIAEPERIREAP